MPSLPEKKFSFTSKAMPEDTFAVVSFKGFEAISHIYEFDIRLVTDDPDVSIEDVLNNPVKFTIHRDDDTDVDFNGILASFEELNEFSGYIFYRARLVPKIWWLTLTHHNQVCLDQSVPEIIELALKDGGLSSQDFEFKTKNNFPPLDYVCQYSESHFNFVSRWLEREGIYYFFEQNDNGEKLIFTDTAVSQVDLAEGGTLYYSPPSGLDESHRMEVIHSLSCRQRPVPEKVRLRDRNYEKPHLELEGSATVDKNGRDETYLYGERFKTTDEGNRLAQIRAEELLCRRTVLHGESTVPFMSPGYTFSLEDHYRDAYNKKYLITEVTHEGSQSGFLISGLGEAFADMDREVFYHNSFTAIPEEVQFRPERTAHKPKIAGTLHAHIDAEGSGEYAELDDHGRYKIRLPFDINDEHGDGKASAYVRMAQPYAGTEHGMHFPLHKGTEVLLTFIDGDPDRPIIAGAVPNPDTMSPVTSANQSESVIKTAGDNKIRIEDRVGTERIIMETPSANSWVRMGAPNDPPPPRPTFVRDEDPTSGIKIHTDGDFRTVVAQTGGDYSFSAGPKMGVYVDGDVEQIITGNLDEHVTGSLAQDVTQNITKTATGSVDLNAGGRDYLPKVPKSETDPTLVTEPPPAEGMRISSKKDMMIFTNDGDISINAADQKKNLIIKCHTRSEDTKYEYEENIWGTSTSKRGGLNSEEFYGGKFEFHLAEALEIFLGFKEEIFAGLWKHETNICPKTELSCSVNFGFNVLGNIETSGFEIAKKQLEIKNAKATLKKRQLALWDKGLGLEFYKFLKIIS